MRELIKMTCIIALGLAPCYHCFGQDLETIENKRWEIIGEIDRLAKDLYQTRESRHNIVNDIIQNEEAVREKTKRLKDLQSKLESTDQKLKMLKDSIDHLASGVNELLGPYRILVKEYYIQKLLTPNWRLLLGLGKISPLFKRKIVLGQLERSVQEASAKIAQQKNALLSRQSEYEQLRDTQSVLYKENEAAITELRDYVVQLDSMLTDLTFKESEINTNLKAYRDTREILNKAIEELKIKKHPE